MSDTQTDQKLLIATPLYAPEIGGPATYTSWLEKELPAHGCELLVVPFSRVRRRSKWVRHLSYLRELWRHRDEADLIYALDPVSVGLPAALLSWLSGKPLMLRIAGDYAWEAMQLRAYSDTEPLEFTKHIERQSWRLRLLHAIQRFSARKAKAIIVPSRYLKEVIKKWGIEPEKITVIYNALPHGKAGLDRVAARNQLSLDQRAPVVVSAGRLIPLKRFAAVIEAIDEVRKTLPTAQLLIVGDGPELSTLKALVNELALDEAVYFTGRVSQDQLADIFSAADVFVLNSVYETFPNIVLEAATAGLPVVATDVGGIKEIKEAGLPGVQLVPSGDQATLVKHLLDQLRTSAESTDHLTDPVQRPPQFAEAKLVEELLRVIGSVTQR